MTRKGIILSGGRGTRLQPLTNVISKQMLPVYDKPMIFYPLSVLMMAGIREIMIVSTSSDLPRFEQLFGDGSRYGLQISYGVQEEPLGIAHALLVSEAFIQNDPVALVLGDNIFYGADIGQLLQTMHVPEVGALIFGYEVPNAQRYGVIRFDEANNPVEIIEKPQIPPSNYAVTGLYFYDNQVIDIAQSLKPSKRGELEITDVNNIYMQRGTLEVIKLGKGFAWFDSGTFEDLHKASTYVQIVQEMHNTKVGCIEEIAYKMGFITEDQLKSLADFYQKSTYGAYLYALLSETQSLNCAL